MEIFKDKKTFLLKEELNLVNEECNWLLKDLLDLLDKDPLLFFGWNLIEFDYISHEGDGIVVKKWEYQPKDPKAQLPTTALGVTPSALTLMGRSCRQASPNTA